MFKNKQVQPEYSKLGITATDVNADITLVQYINEYERIYGKIELDSFDVVSPDLITPNFKGLTNSISPIRMDFRNRNLVELLNNTPFRKVLVLYGAAHVSGVIDMLKKDMP